MDEVTVKRAKTYFLLFFSFLMAFSQLGRALESKNLETQIETILKPFRAQQGVEGTIKTRDDQEISYVYFKHPEAKATIVYMQGWTEHHGGANEFAYDMYQKGVSTFFFDWRGQGRSSRPLEDTFRSHIMNYDDYMIDVEAFMEKIVLPNRQGKLIAGAFSMGANILSLYETEHPGTFDLVFLVSPMLDIKTSIPQRLVWFMCKAAELFGFGPDYIFGSKGFDGTTINMGTRSEERFQPWREYRKQYPETVINGVSWSWMRASLEATWNMRDRAEKMITPILMLQAGNDAFVNTEGQDYVCKKAKSCLKVVFPKSMHAILAEVDHIRDKAIREILDFIEFGGADKPSP